jgi:hypothetical protein
MRRLSTYDHEQVGQKSVFAQMILPVIEMIFTLFRFVGEVELGQLSESAETQHGEGARQACHSATAGHERIPCLVTR